MAQKTLLNISVIDDKGNLVLYSKRIIEEIGTNKKILNAVLQLNSARVGKYDVVRVDCHGDGKEVVDYLTPCLDRTLVINVTHEVNCLLQKEKPSITLHFENNATRCSSVHLLVEYIPQQIMHQSNSYVDIDVKGAGSGKINLATGNLQFESAGLVYNGWQANKEQIEVDDAVDGIVQFDTHCGKGWKLGVEQHLVKRNSSSNEEVYTYIDGSGNYHEFVEKYYYFEFEQKHYVAKKDVNIDLDGKLTYRGQEVKVERRSTNGLTLETDYSGFQYGHLIEQRQDEQIQLEENVESYKRQFGEYVIVDKNSGDTLGALDGSELTQQVFDDFISKAQQNLLLTKSESVQYNSLLLQRTKDLKKAGLSKIGKIVSWKNDDYKNIPVAGNKSLIDLRTDLQTMRSNLTRLTKKVNAAAGSSKEDYQYVEYLQYLQTHRYAKDLNCCIADLASLENSSVLLPNINQSFKDEKNGLYIKLSHFKDNLCDLQAELERVNDDLDYYNRKDAKDNVKETRIRQKVLEQRLRVFQKEFNNKIDSIQQKISEIEDIINTYLENEQNRLIDEQIEMLINSSEYHKTDIQKYYKQYVNYKHQLDMLYAQFPTHFIVGAEVTMGFNKFGNLSMLFDEYENQTAIIYEDGKIVSIKDTDNNETSFEYLPNGLLSKIIGSDEKITSFKYDNEHNLLSISSGDEEIAKFDYCYREHKNNGGVCSKGELKVIEDRNGYAVELVYDNSCRIKQVKETTNIYSVATDKVLRNDQREAKIVATIAYHESNQATSVTNSNNVTTTYIFDQLGKPVTVYEGEYDSTNVTKAISFEYVAGKQSFAIEEKVRLQNLIDSAEVVDDTLPASETPCQRIRQIRIDQGALRHGVTDYVFSAWAKANSAYIKDVRKTDCTFGTIDKETERYLDIYQRDRKFELRAEVNYATGEPDVYSASFDWLNADWQYLALPVEIVSSDQDGDRLPGSFPIKIGSPAREVVCINLYVDYSFNVGDVELSGLSFREGTWAYSTFDDKGNKITDEDSSGKTKTTYHYDDKDRVVKSVAVDKLGRQFTSTYEYNKQGKTVRTTNYAGVVEETVFDEKGREVKRIKYNVDDPTSKLYAESKRDDKGVITADVDESGEYDSVTYTYDHKGEAIVQADGKGNKTAVGYKDGNLVSISGSADGEESTNTMKYTADLLTKTSNGDTDYDFTYDGWGRTTKVEIAGETYLNVEHKGDTVTTTRLANGVDITTEVDDHGNVKQQTTQFANNIVETITNNYDDLLTLKSKIIDTGNGRGYNIEYEYDDLSGKLTREIHVKNGVRTDFKTHSYTTDGDLERTEYKVGDETLSYTFETDGTPDKRNVKVQLPFELEQNLAYDGLGRTKEISLGANLVKDVYYAKYGDHATSRINSVWHGVNGVRKDNTRYTYDKAGNIETVTDNGKLVARYRYDGLNRLVREDNVHFGTTILQYDHAGNILSKTVHPFTLDDTVTVQGKEYHYEYAQHGWKDQLTSFNGLNCADYDALGNPTVYKGRSLSWQGRRLLSYGKDRLFANFTYDVNGVRTSKTITQDGVAVVENKYFYDGNQLIAEQIVNNGSISNRYYIYGADGVAGFSQDGATYLYRKNAQGDVTHIYKQEANGSLVLVAQYVYDAWGNCKILLDVDGIATANPFRYRSYYLDVETDLYYLQTRYYDPETGRFISADSIDYLDPETLGGLNLYAYCGNNPIMAVDPMGTAWWHWVVGALVVIALVAATVISAGGFAAGMFAIGAAACGIASATMTTTVLAFATVGAGVAYAAYAGYSLFTAVERGITTNSFNTGLNTFMDMGADALAVTVSAGITGGFGGYISYTQQIGDPSRAGFMSKSERDKQRRDFWISQAKDPTSDYYGNKRALQGLAVDGLEISHIYGTYGNNRYYFILSTKEEHKAFHAIYGYKTFGGPFNRINPNYINWWQFLKSIFGGW